MKITKRNSLGVLFGTAMVIACLYVFASDNVVQSINFSLMFTPKSSNITTQAKSIMNSWDIGSQLCLGKGIKPVFPQSSKLSSYLEYLKEPLEFLENFKNPCFYRNVTIYNNKPIKTPVNALRCLPYFMIVGQPKCGTTDIWRGLQLHPEVVANHRKENGYFSSRRFPPYNFTFDKYLDIFHQTTNTIASHPLPNKLVGGKRFYHQITALEWYKLSSYTIYYRPGFSFRIPFTTRPSCLGDGAVRALTFNDKWYLEPGNEGCNEPRVLNAHIIRHINPNTKLIITLRNPVDRVYSNYIYSSYHTGDKISVADFHHIVQETIKKHKNCRKYLSKRGCAYNSSLETHQAPLRAGMYHVFIEDWLRVFPTEQLNIIHFETFTKQRLTVMNEIFKFLDLRALSIKEEEREVNRYIANPRPREGKILGEMMNETRRILENFYAPFNERLATLLKDKLFLWRQ